VFNLVRARLAIAALAVPLALAAPLVAATPAFAHSGSSGSGAVAPTPAPTPGASSAPSSGTTTAPAAGDDGTRAWSVRPATSKGLPDKRTHFTMQGSPGQDVLDQVLVTNSSKVAASFDIYATDAFNTPAGAFDLLPAAKKPVDIGSWVTFPANTVAIPAGQSVAVQFKVSVPANAAPGDHAGGIVVSLSSGSNVRLDTRVAVRLYMRVPGFLRPILGVTYVTPTFTGSTFNPFATGSVDVSYTVVNTGNIRLQSHPTVTVKSALFGATLATVKPADLAEILPGQEVTYTAHLTGVYPAGPLTVTVALQPYADPEQPVGQVIPSFSGSATIWAVPWLLLIVIVLILGGLGYLTFRMVRRRRGPDGARPVGPAPTPAPSTKDAKDADKSTEDRPLADATTAAGGSSTSGGES
jgi:hypothetical protein